MGAACYVATIVAEDLMTRSLVEIRDEMRRTREELSARLDTTREELSTRIDTTNERLDRLEQRQHASEVRLATELVAVAAAIRQLTDLFRDEREVRSQVADHERRLSAIERSRHSG